MSDITVSVTETPSLVTITVVEGAGASATWGGIAGVLSNQLDLQAALNAKHNVDSLATTSVNLAITTQTVVVCTNTIGITVTLPASASNIGKRIMVIQQNTGSVSAAAAGSDTINGNPSVLMNARYSVLEVLSTSMGWLII